MPKTKRDLLSALAARLGGPPADRIRDLLQRPTPFDDLLDRPLSDADYAAQLARLARELPASLAQMSTPAWSRPATWGLLN